MIRCSRIKTRNFEMRFAKNAHRQICRAPRGMNDSSVIPLLSSGEWSVQLALLPPVLLLIALNLPPFPGRSAFCIPILSSAFVCLFYTKVDDLGLDFALNSGYIYLAFLSIDLLALRNGNAEDIRKVGQRTARTGISKFRWSVGLICTMRGSGWSSRNKNTPKSSTLSRKLFLMSRLVRSGLAYIVVDVCTRYLEFQPYFKLEMVLSDVAFGRRLVNQSFAVMTGTAGVILVYSIQSVVGVALHLWSVDEAPDLFGSISHSRTIAGFWSKTWYALARSLPTVVLSYSAS